MWDDAAPTAQPDELEPVSTGDDQVPDSGDGGDAAVGSLAEDVSALIEDGKTYFDAELAYQKARAGYAGQKTKQGIIFGLGAFAFLHLALIGLVIGLIIALEPYLSAFGSTALVVGILLAGVVWMGWLAAQRFKAVGAAFDSKMDSDGQG